MHCMKENHFRLQCLGHHFHQKETVQDRKFLCLGTEAIQPEGPGLQRTFQSICMLSTILHEEYY